MELIFDKSRVMWDYKDKKYEYFVENIFEATLKNDYIFIHSTNYQGATYIHLFTYLTLEGKLIMCESGPIGIKKTIKILDENGKEISFNIPNLMLWSISTDAKYLYGMIMKEGSKDGIKVVLYSLHGKLLSEHPVPKGYTISRFFDELDKDGNVKLLLDEDPPRPPETNPRSFHNWLWKFSLNIKTGEWKKIELIPEI
jgi:hypothetical protein